MNLSTSNDSDLVELVIKIAENNDMTPRFGYSGRNMYGKNCFGLVGNIANIGGFLIDLVTDLMEDENNIGFDYNTKTQEFIDSFREMAVDSMGRDSIMYFPGLNIVDDTDSKEIDE